MQPSTSIWFNGELVPWDEARIHVLSHVVHYGTGAFEGIRVYALPAGPAVLGLQQHVRRLFRSCKIIELTLPFTVGQVSDAILQTVAHNGHESCYVRPIAFRGYGELGVLPDKCPIELVIATFPWRTMHGQEALEKGVDIGVSSWRRMAPNTHPAMGKLSGNYLNSHQVILEAKRHGYAEGVMLDSEGFVAECSGENLFLAFDGDVYTPPLSASILPGVTRAFVIQLLNDFGIVVREERLPREMLYCADEIFMTGTAAEITPVRSVDRRRVGSGTRGPATQRLQQEFFGILRGEVEDRHDWLTPVHGQR